MPRIPLAVVSTSSDDSGDSVDDLAYHFKDTNWTVVNMASIESYPFSEVSHQPYEQESNFLDSVSQGSALMRHRNSTSARQDMGSVSQRISPQSPHPLLPHGMPARPHLPLSLGMTHPRTSNSDSFPSPHHNRHSSHSIGSGAATGAATTSSPKTGAVAPTAKTAGPYSGDLSMSGAVPGAPPLGRRGRKVKPVAQRRRSLQVGAPRWRDSEGDMEMLVRREVSKNGPVSPPQTADYSLHSPLSSHGSGPMTPPPLWAGDGQLEKGGRDELEPPEPVAAAAATAADDSAQKKVAGPDTDAAIGTDSVAKTNALPAKQEASQASVVSNAAPQQKANGAPTALTKPSGLSKLNAAAQRQPLAAKTAAAPTAKTKPKQLQPHVLHPPAAGPPSGLAKANSTSVSPVMLSSRAGLPTGGRITPLNDKQRATASVPPVSSSTASFLEAAPTVDATHHSPSSSPLAQTTKPQGVASASAGAGPAGGGKKKPAAATDTPLPPLSPIATDSATSPTPFLEPAVESSGESGERPHSATQPSPHQRRRTSRRPSMQSRDTEASSVETVEVRTAVRHATLKPLVTSPDVLPPLPPPAMEAGREASTLRGTLPALTPHRLSAPSSLATTPIRAAKSTPAGAAACATTRLPRSGRASQPTLPVAPLAASGSQTPLRADSPALEASPPRLRPETREFTEHSREQPQPQHQPPNTPGSASPASRATAERLVTFVRAVSDPEVLHVIYDYLLEQQRAAPRYRLAAAACAELLERKEDLLQTQDSMADFSGAGARPSGVFTHEVDDEPFVVDARPPAGVVGGAADSRAEELRRLLGGVPLEAGEDAEGASDGGADGADADDDDDEFDDLNFFDTPYPPASHFNFGQPSVSGVVSRVFAEGMLFKIKTAKGEYYFYNDTLQDVMMVRVQCVLRGNEVINERAMLAPVENSAETEITIAVLPEETNFFLSGVSHLPHFMAKRVPVPRDYVSPSVTQALRRINADINAVRRALGKWSRASDQNAFLKCCLKQHLKFTDLNFRPSAESLCRPKCDAVSLPPLTWRRPEEYVYLPEVSQTRLFRKEISCFLVKQGELENHTVVAAMAAVAQFPSHVRWMFRHPVSAHVGRMERAVGCYRVTLLHNGWWKTYVIDDYVPASQKGPLFASCAEDPRRLWVPLLEKAYAKSLGSYAATCVVDAMDAMVDFTGFPVRYLDALWAAAKAKPTGPPSRSLFSYIDRVVSAGCTVLLFTPAASDEEARHTVNLSRMRSSRLLPVNGVLPQFLPGHIYFLHEVAVFEALDLRMARLKNPWTWETRHRANREKKWKYTTWYDRPDVSVSAMGSFVSSAAPAERAANPPAPELSAEEQLRNERKGTMWVEWGEVLAAFAGGGVCYTLWDRHRYRVKNAFVNGRPRFVLEVKARRRVELFVTLTLETVSETLDSFDAVVASRPTPLYGTAMAAVQRVSSTSATVVCESCEDVESVAGRRTYVMAKDVSMKLTVDPAVAEGTVLVVPLLDPHATEALMAAAAASTGGRSGGGSPPTSEVHFVLSMVSDAVAGDNEELSVAFVSMRRSCGVFTDSGAVFDLEGTARVTSSYQLCTERGVVTLEGNRICDAEAAKPA